MTRAIDRAVAALASKVAPRVGSALAPVLIAELEKFKQAIWLEMTHRVRNELNRQMHDHPENTIRSGPGPHLDELNSRQTEFVKEYLAREAEGLVKELVREQHAMSGAARDHRNIRWFHSVDLGDGTITDGFKSLDLLETEFSALQLSAASLAGKRVLDIGCNDGFFSLKCARLGADVTAVDGIATDGLKYVQQYASPKFRFYCIDMMSPSFCELGHFDVILYLGVLYHTMFPFEQLVKIASACANNAAVFVETEYYNMPGCENDPTIFFDYNQKLSIDASSPVYPSTAWITQTLARLGFAPVTLLDPPSPPTASRGRVTIRADYPGRASPRQPFIYAAEQIESAGERA
jgi:tRNA (mo5U34)-methyltransferase